jgi:hypothetical protein
MKINENKFEDYFFDVRRYKPQKGQVIAKFTAIAELIEGKMKRDLIDLVKHKDKAEVATKVMRKLGCAIEKDSVVVLRKITEDLLVMTEEEVLIKPYEYVCEMFFYTKAEHVPLNNPHWSIISIMNLNKYF